ncbi:MAG: TRAP transporter small permease subunit [Desulfobacterota bacterium]|nr:TRAP transporter small permease subunit [Thermodesulfobacteriota bacterium]MDW8001368.1 TRAP transporter small permease [Deltaproteobacteria bacterium]
MGGLKALSLHINKFCAFLSGICIVILTALALGNMIFRIVYRPIQGSYELIGFFGAVSVGLALGYTQMRKDHVIVTILSDKFNLRLRRFLDRISYTGSALFFVISGWQTFRWGTRLLKTGELSETLKIIYYPFVYALAFGFFVIAFTLIVDLLLTLERK